MRNDDLDPVAVFRSSNLDAEMEALNVCALLESSGIPALVVGPSTIPSLGFQVQVPRNRLQDSERVIAEARDAGPEGAAEAEAASEETNP